MARGVSNTPLSWLAGWEAVHAYQTLRLEQPANVNERRADFEHDADQRIELSRAEGLCVRARE